MSAYAAATGSCVTITTVCSRSSTASRRKERISAPVRESRLPVGSSAKTISGRPTSARATATRCCWPPDSSAGRCPSRSPSPTAATTAANHSGSGRRPARVSGSAMFSAAFSAGTRLKPWKTNPARSRRNTVSCRSDRLPSSTSPMNTCPEDSVSSPATQCMSVDLPAPDGPMIAVNRPAGNATLTSSIARTSAAPGPVHLGGAGRPRRRASLARHRFLFSSECFPEDRGVAAGSSSAPERHRHCAGQGRSTPVRLPPVAYGRCRPVTSGRARTGRACRSGRRRRR